ncbi:OLC1v1002903C1 [Oldenlandia corymbosa var. corymbosa]|nr:OLC1v1002903C1 [Oldenlandia corymbosa var. corymbosa]
MFKGGLAANYSGSAELYFECDHPSTEIWADGVSLQPFTQEEWASHRNQSVEKVRKSKVKIRAIDHTTGNPMVNATVEIKAVTTNFPLGNAVSNRILTIPAYQDWFAKRFRYAVFENEMKWQWNEPQPGQEDYHFADRMFQFVQKNNIKTRGHNVVWENDFWLPNWAKNMDANQLKNATIRRQLSIMRRYRGQVIHWDVVNENLHFSYFEDKFQSNRASYVFYKRAQVIDGEAVMFLNDFDTIEKPSGFKASPAKYLEKIDLIRSQGYDGPLGIGIQGHFYDPPVGPYIRSALDALATAELPIWISELDVNVSWPKAAEYLEEALRELQAHPAVEGIMIWAPWSPPDCYRMCITDADFKNLPTGDVVDKLLDEWSHAGGFVGSTDKDGYFHSSLFHGDYELRINHPSVANSSKKSYKFKVESSRKVKHVVLKISPEISSN